MRQSQTLLIDNETPTCWIQLWLHIDRKNGDNNKYRLSVKSESESSEYNYTLDRWLSMWQKLNEILNNYSGVKPIELQIDHMYEKWKSDRAKSCLASNTYNPDCDCEMCGIKR